MHVYMFIMCTFAAFVQMDPELKQTALGVFRDLTSVRTLKSFHKCDAEI